MAVGVDDLQPPPREDKTFMGFDVAYLREHLAGDGHLGMPTPLIFPFCYAKMNSQTLSYELGSRSRQ
jgi:hypothetical protein